MWNYCGANNMSDLVPVEVKAFNAEQLSAIEKSGSTFTWPIPGSKSITNRALILAAISPFPVTLKGVLHSDDTRHMTKALTSLGVEISQDENEPETVYVKGGVNKIKTYLDTLKENIEIFVGNSGTTVRFLTSLVVFISSPVAITLTGDEHMAKRPLADLTDVLIGLTSSKLHYTKGTSCPPLEVVPADSSTKRKVTPKSVEMKGNKSSQYFTSLMMSAHLLITEPLEIIISGTLISVPYVEMTAEMMGSFGLKAELLKTENKVTSIKVYPRDEASLPKLNVGASFVYEVEADASAASYAFAAAAATRSSVKVNTRTSKSMQGDYGFVDILERLGCEVVKGEGFIEVTGKELGGKEEFVENMGDISDTVMSVAAIAPLVNSKIKIVNVANIRIKETDRLEATVNELKRLGQKVEFGEDWLQIIPQDVQPAEIECYSDHRMAMAFAILALMKPGILIKDKFCVNKTYPEFWNHLQQFQTFATSA
eukprot:maker-scaffold_5-snap-gene-19.1-mRNA-1 protein AED:0.02 eAED:0.02 QI:121/1/1/1/1/1/3/153/482